MIKRFLILLGVNKMWLIRRGSNKAVATFNKALIDLRLINEDILEHRAEHQRIIDDSIAAQSVLMSNHAKNNKFIANLEKMFE